MLDEYLQKSEKYYGVTPTYRLYFRNFRLCFCCFCFPIWYKYGEYFRKGCEKDRWGLISFDFCPILIINLIKNFLEKTDHSNYFYCRIMNLSLNRWPWVFTTLILAISTRHSLLLERTWVTQAEFYRVYLIRSYKFRQLCQNSKIS